MQYGNSILLILLVIWITSHLSGLKCICHACSHSWRLSRSCWREVVYFIEKNRSTKGCSKLKRSIDMTNSGMNGLNIIEQVQVQNGTGPCVRRRSKRPLLACHIRCKCSMETSRHYVITSKTVMRSISVTRSWFGEMVDQLRVSLYMIMSQNFM